MGLLRINLKRKNQATRSEIRRARPIRNPAIRFEQADDGSVMLFVPVTQRGFLGRTIGKMVPEDKQVELEPIGAFVWKLCDGKRTVQGITEALQREFKITRVEAEASLLAFLDTLMKRRYVALEVPKK
ncbi:MAG: PqqD family protein [Fimbriimonadales bacterium]|nr:PqqD family protein [Fimbriimonadales bacterium]